MSTETQGHRDTETQRHRDTETQRHRNTETQRHRNTETQRHRNTETQRHRDTETRDRERDCFYYIIVQTYEVGLHSRRHPIEMDAGTRPLASFDAPIS